MPRPRNVVPSYRYHKARDCAVVRIDGRDFYLTGDYGSEESKREYARLIAEHQSRPHSVVTPESSYSCGQLALGYLRFAESYYVKNGRPTTQIHQVRRALKGLCELYDTLPLIEFGPLKFKALQQHWVGQGQSRVYVNKLGAVIKQAVKWACSEELAPPSVHHGLLTVPGLKRGRTSARETEPVLPVDEAVVNETIKHLSPVVAAMIQLQRLTGMRPAEVCLLRPCDVSLHLDGTAVYQPSEHKTEHHEKERRVYLGPKALTVLKPFLNRHPEAYCFDPREALAWYQQQRRASRKTPLYASHVRHLLRKRKADPRRSAKERFTSASYRRAIERAVRRAFPVPEGFTDEQAAAWWKRHDWAPNQLRHLRATEIRREYGIEAAQVTLGHSNLSVTQTYAERDFTKAREIALASG